jgi:hypothetical protein
LPSLRYLSNHRLQIHLNPFFLFVFEASRTIKSRGTQIANSQGN